MLVELLRWEVYELRSKKRLQDFTRNRKMSFTELMYFMLNMAKASSQNALERFFPQLKKENLRMSQQAFSAARQKVKWEAFQEMHEVSVEGSYHEQWETWNGYRVMAIDGSFIQLPDDAKLLAYFGGLGPEQTSPTALGSILYDLLNDIIVDARLVPVSRDERSLAEEHLEALKKLESFNRGHELIIFDRGYPSHGLVKSLQDKEIKYLMRTQKNFAREIAAQESGDGWAVFGPEKLRVRVIKLMLKSGEEETLITNLDDPKLGVEDFRELYHRRWGVETKYDQVKKKLELENFSGRLVDNVKQDFYAMMTVANMIASLVREADREVKKERDGSGNRYEYQVNVNHAIGVFKDRLIRVMIAEDMISRDYLLKELIHEIKRRVVPLRPNREVSRNESHRKVRFHHNHKSNC
jgi:hypothetical protein